MLTCFFVGHRDAPQSIQEELYKTVVHLVRNCHVDHFIVGHYGEFDRMATAVVQRVIREFPEKAIIAEMLEPYFPGGRKILVPLFFDGVYYPSGMECVPPRFCIEKANQKALDVSDVLVAYVSRSGGNAAKLLRRAMREEKTGYLKVISLGEYYSTLHTPNSTL